MKAEEVRALSDVEIRKKLDDYDKELVNHRELEKVRRDVARLNTILKERELGIR